MVADPDNGDFCLQCVGIKQFNTGLIITSPEDRHCLASWTKAASHVYVFSGLNSFWTGPIKAPRKVINLTAQMHGQIWVFAARTFHFVGFAVHFKKINWRSRKEVTHGNVHLEPGLWCVCFRCILRSSADDVHVHQTLVYWSLVPRTGHDHNRHRFKSLVQRTAGCDRQLRTYKAPDIG